MDGWMGGWVRGREEKYILSLMSTKRPRGNDPPSSNDYVQHPDWDWGIHFLLKQTMASWRMADSKVWTGLVQYGPGEPRHTRERESHRNFQLTVKVLLCHFNIVSSPQSNQERGQWFPNNAALQSHSQESGFLSGSCQRAGYQPKAGKAMSGLLHLHESFTVNTAPSWSTQSCWAICSCFPHSQKWSRNMHLSDTAVNFFDTYFYINLPQSRKQLAISHKLEKKYNEDINALLLNQMCFSRYMQINDKSFHLEGYHKYIKLSMPILLNYM